MAVYSKHPASAPPAPPIREKTGHVMLRAWCVFVLFSAFAGTAWVNAFGLPISVVITVSAGMLSAVLWVLVRPPLQWRRLPWGILAYVAWATMSVVWSAWPAATWLTLLLLYITTLQALFVGSVLSWHELVRAIGSGLKWVIGLSLAFELWVSLFVGVPVLPGFVPRTESVDPILYWSRNNLFDGGRIQGIVGNANLLGAIALVAIIVFAILIAMSPQRRGWPIAWLTLSAYMFVRAGSATAVVGAAAVLLVLATVLLMRTASKPGERTRYYVIYAALAVGGAVILWLVHDAIFTALGRTADLTGREAIWTAVLDRTGERPWIGWGFSTPWVSSEPAFDGWIIDHGESVMQAHNMWVDVSLQLGVIGLILMAGIYLTFIWRAWFFAVDRPRWDLESNRPYSAITLLPTLLATVLLVQGVAESNPLMLWGWMLVVMLAAKVKQSPLVGEGPAERRAAIERGDVVGLRQ
ncbi:O-antigen ligase family protein [Microbacterium sp. NPDC076911]|uniref:O-antigen ligase family protein n=1 Tax=Microbacterium sp. NPDC076911 TaxID=3154958 RepID=UPI00343BFF93